MLERLKAELAELEARWAAVMKVLEPMSKLEFYQKLYDHNTKDYFFAEWVEATLIEQRKNQVLAQLAEIGG